MFAASHGATQLEGVSSRNQVGTVGLNILSLGYAHMYDLLKLHICLFILWLLDTVPHCYPGKHGAVHECGM
eukprot:1101682-Pelagomonas_calceolata.AAC.2